MILIKQVHILWYKCGMYFEKYTGAFLFFLILINFEPLAH